MSIIGIKSEVNDMFNPLSVTNFNYFILVATDENHGISGANIFGTDQPMARGTVNNFFRENYCVNKNFQFIVTERSVWSKL